MNAKMAPVVNALRAQRVADIAAARAAAASVEADAVYEAKSEEFARVAEALAKELFTTGFAVQDAARVMLACASSDSPTDG